MVESFNKNSLIKHVEGLTLSKFHYSLLLINSLIYAFTAMNVMLIGAALPAIIVDWKIDPITAGIFLSAGYLGMFIGALSCGFLTDFLGRKKALLITLCMMAIFTGICSIAWDPFSMSLLRFLAGIGLGGSLPQPGVYISEFIPAKHRGRFIGLVETSWVYGALLSIIFPFILLPTYGWRLTFLIAFIPLFLIPLIIYFLPESIRYLEIKGKKEEALKLLRKYGLLKARSIKGIENSKDTLNGFNLKTSFKELFSSSYLRRTIILWILWAVLVYTYHGIFIWLPTIYVEVMHAREFVGPLYWVLIVTLAQVPGYYSASMLLDYLGRKPILASYLAIAGIASYFLGITKGLYFIVAWSCIISFFNLGAWAGLYAYTPELYPTRIRGIGSGMAASIGRLAGILAPTLTGYLLSIGGLSLAFTVFALAHLIAAICVILLGIETKGMTLEEISK